MNLSILEKFKRSTGYNLESFFQDYTLFVSNFYPIIVNYYNGGEIDNNSFTFLDSLKKEVSKIESLIDQYSNSFETTEYWNMVDLISSIQTALFTVDNLSKWTKSSRTDRFTNNIKVDYIQKQNELIETISTNLGFNNQDDWLNLSIQNQINEEDYTNKGGKLLKASLPLNSVFELDNIVDSLSQENIFGKDIVKQFSFEDGDLKTIEGKESLKQTFDTIMSTIKGSIPEFEQDGVPDYLIGTNQNIIQYPVLFRSILSMMQKDKRFSSFELLDIKKEQDMVIIETQTKTITGDILVRNINL